MELPPGHEAQLSGGLGFRVLGFRVLGFRVLGFRFLGFRFLGLGFRVLGFRFRVSRGNVIYWLHRSHYRCYTWGNGKEDGNYYNGLYRVYRIYIGEPPPL